MSRASLWVAGLALAGSTLVASGWAQSSLGQAPSLQQPPLQQQWQQEGSPPVQQSPVSPGDTGQGATGQADPLQANPGQGASQPDLQGQQQTPPGPAPMGQPATIPNVWIPAGAAKLQALDKVNAQASELTVKVGQSATFGSLTITVKSCVVRPTDQPADAAAFLAVTDSRPDSSGFDGWILQAEPSVSMMQHPIYDLRIVGCA